MRTIILSTIAVAIAIPVAAQTTTRDSAGIHIVDNAARAIRAYRHVAATPSVILGASSAPEDQFGAVAGAIRLSDGRIVVADGPGRVLREFDASGHFLRSIGQQGEGPGDFQEIVGLFRAPHDSIVTWDLNLNRVTWFSPSGVTLRTAAVERLPGVATPGIRGAMLPVLTGIGRFADGTLLAESSVGRIGGTTGMFVDSITVWTMAHDSSLTRVGAELRSEWWGYRDPSTHVSTGGARPFGRTGSLAVGATRWYATGGDTFEVREFTETGTLRRVFRVARERQPVTDAEAAAVRAAEVDQAPAKYRAFTEEAEKSIDFPKLKPAYTGLRVDDAGRVWAERYAADTVSHAWDVFDPSGKLIGDVTVPARCSVLQVEADLLLCRVTDADDVQTVRVYRLTP